jgi:hypothetical protein
LFERSALLPLHRNHISRAISTCLVKKDSLFNHPNND